MISRSSMETYGNIAQLRPCRSEDVRSSAELLAALLDLPRLQHVKAVDFSLVHDLVEDEAVEVVIGASTRLEELSLRSSPFVSAEALSDLAERHANTLTSLVTPGWDHAEAEDHVTAVGLLSRLSALKHLHILSDESVHYIPIITHLSMLTKLSLWYDSMLTKLSLWYDLAQPVGASDVLAAAARLPALVDLCLPPCHTWDTDEAVSLLQSLSSLSALQIGGYWWGEMELPSRVLSAIAALPDLKDLALVDPVTLTRADATQLSTLQLQSFKVIWNDDHQSEADAIRERGNVLAIITPSWPLTRLMFTSDADGCNEPFCPVFDGDQLLPTLHHLQDCLLSLHLVDAVVPRHLFALLRQLRQLQLLSVHECVHVRFARGRALYDSVPIEDLGHLTRLTTLHLGSPDHSGCRGFSHDEVPASELACLTALKELSVPVWHPTKEQLMSGLLPLQQLRALTTADLTACPLSRQEACDVLQRLGALEEVTSGYGSCAGHRMLTADVKRLARAQ
jgi:hypothetical protein